MRHIEAHVPGDAGLPEGRRWAVAHVETSGTRLTSDRVIGLCILVLGGDGMVEDEYATAIDPGPDFGLGSLHHRLRDRLAGAPHFEDVTDRVVDLLHGRTLVAYDASTHYGFLDGEFRRADIANPIVSRLCVRTLSRRLELDVPNLQLTSLAEHWGIERRPMGDKARDEADLVARVFLSTLGLADSLELPLPVVECVANKAGAPRLSRRVPCPWVNPGRFDPGVGLVQGTKVAIIGTTKTPRDALERKLALAGLDVMSTAGSHVGLVICNDRTSGSTEVSRLLDDGISVIPEKTLERLLESVLPGIPRTKPEQDGWTALPAVDEASPERAHPERPVETASTDSIDAVASADPVPTSLAEQPTVPSFVDNPWQNRHILVIGGTHEDAAAMRSKIARLGGTPAINLSAAVTDLLVLGGDGRDRKTVTIGGRELPVLTPEILKEANENEAMHSDIVQRRPGVRSLARGEVVDLHMDDTQVSIHASWRADSTRDGIIVDIVGFMLSEENSVNCDEDFVFYNFPSRDDGAMALTVDGNCEQSIHIDLKALPDNCVRIAIAAAIEGTATFGQLGPVAVKVEASEQPEAEFVLDAGTTERTMVLCEVYRRANRWRLRAFGQGYDSGLDALATLYGVDVK
ncbi:TerD family protein [Rhodococcus sp. CH91]|uniref:TerD family protein n=1 Tax=Rhodococcus sp. CH91 TaxID=2910256 RepID=UPI001F4A5766|nr:TerD family protein [Rhodococcus sp. CH91]